MTAQIPTRRVDLVKRLGRENRTKEAAMTITDAALSIIVLGMLVLAFGVDLAALFGWLRGLQIGQYRLPTAPPPDVLANILRTAIEERVDQRELDRVLRQERRIRRELSKRFAP